MKLERARFVDYVIMNTPPKGGAVENRIFIIFARKGEYGKPRTAVKKRKTAEEAIVKPPQNGELSQKG